MHDSTDPDWKIWFWHARFSNSLTTQEQLTRLPDRQQAIYHSLKSYKRRREYLHSRLLICTALSELYQLPTDSWLIRETQGAPPYIPGLNHHLSLSHSNNLACLTLSRIRTGVDAERMKPDRDFKEAAKLFMTAAERDQLPDNPEEVPQYFYRLWCAKEALYKALPRKEQEIKTLATIEFSDLLDGKKGWQLTELNIPQYRIAIVHESTTAPVQLITTQLELE